MLLQDIQQAVGCPYLSDLREEIYLNKIRYVVMGLNPENYPPQEWREAVSYILSVSCDYENANAIRDFFYQSVQR